MHPIQHVHANMMLAFAIEYPLVATAYVIGSITVIYLSCRKPKPMEQNKGR